MIGPVSEHRLCKRKENTDMGFAGQRIDALSINFFYLARSNYEIEMYICVHKDDSSKTNELKKPKF